MSSSVLARVNLVLAFAGLFIAGMLSLSSMLGIQLPCGVSAGCDLVTQDPRSNIGGIPIAYYGVMGYTLMMLIAFIRLFAPKAKPRLMHLAGYALSGVGLLVSIGLTVFSITSIHAVCIWCIGSALTMSLLFVSHALMSARNPSAIRTNPGVDTFIFFALVWLVVGGLTFASEDLQRKSERVEVDVESLNEISDRELLPPQVHVIGPPKAKATVVMFGDLTCPVCQSAYFHITRLMSQRNDFKFAYRHLPLQIHPLARPAALVSEMLAEKDHFWPFISECYKTDIRSHEDIYRIAERFGLQEREIRARLSSADDRSYRALDRDAAVCKKLGLHSTPSVFLTMEGYYPEPITYRGIEEMLDRNLK